ncbi:MAG: LURP-one-related family protein [Clostridia bacterium]
MTIKIRRKLFSFPVSYEIKNEETDQAVYKAKGKAFSPTGKVFLRTVDGDKLMLIKHKLFQIRSKYSVYNMDKELVFTLRNKFSAKKNFELTDCADALDIRNTTFGIDWTYSKNGVDIATIHKDLINLTSVFKVTILDEKETDLVVATVLAIDRCFSKRDNNSYN